METNILKRIFFDEHRHWNRFVVKHKDTLRANVVKEVENEYRIEDRLGNGKVEGSS